MARIDGSDRLLVQLQEQLLRLSKERQVRGSSSVAPSALAGAPLQRVRRLAADAGIEEEELRRSVVRSVLLDQLGDQLGADPNFETMSSQVFAMLQRSDEGRQLIGEAIDQLLWAKPST